MASQTDPVVVATPWQFWIDVGGTFTDCLAIAPDGTRRRHKVLSSGAVLGSCGEGSTRQQLVDPGRGTDPSNFWQGYRVQLIPPDGGVPTAAVRVARFDRTTCALQLEPALPHEPVPGQLYQIITTEEAPLLAMRYVLGLARAAPLPPLSVRLGTTRGTNALLTRSGAPTALITTRGFGDLWQIGNQDRPRLFDLQICRTPRVYQSVVEIDERISATGEVIQTPCPAELRRCLKQLKAGGIQSLAICLMHAYAYPRHEQLIAEIAAGVGFSNVSTSHEVAPLIKIIPRGDTTLADAYLNPVLQSYLARLQQALHGTEPCALRLLTSAGGLVGAGKFSGKDSIFSGPAGGVVGCARTAQAAGFTRAIGFDMGGTSTDVSRFDQVWDTVYETEKNGVRISAPMLAIETVAAGGGSLCQFDGVKLTVGPDSAGADPGPACYGKGGPLTITDMNLALRRLLPDRFPLPLNEQIVHHKLTQLAGHIADVSAHRYTVTQLAEDFVDVANAGMAKAIESVSIARGCDPREFVLVCFGGAAPQHACAVADALSITQVLHHPDGGMLSAVGIGLADVVRHGVHGMYVGFSAASLQRAEQLLESLSQTALREVRDERVPADQIDLRHALDLRYRGQESALTIERPVAGDFADAFHAAHRRMFGFADPQRPLEIVAARVTATGTAATTLPAASHLPAPHQPPLCETTQVFFAGRAWPTHIYDRDQLQPGHRVVGPAIIAEAISATVVAPSWTAEVLSDGQLLLTRTTATAAGRQATAADPTQLEIFNHAFSGVAEQMGIILRRTAVSVNVKERLDFSCAVFTAGGDLVVNAPHMPVHLGAMSETIRHVIDDHPDLSPGDAVITNDPYGGGSHLPDITVVTPVFDRHGQQRLFFTASRAHHAELGGVVPGSMPPFSRCLAEEGVLIRSTKIVRGGVSRIAQLRDLLLSGPYPTRRVADNLADVAAQIAANQHGANCLHRLMDSRGTSVVLAYTRHIQDAAEAKMRQALARLPDGCHQFVDHLDDGSPLRVAIKISGDHGEIDFDGTADVHAGNLNANPAIVRAAVIYCLRCLIDEEIPLNEGVLKPMSISIPQGLLHPPDAGDPRQCAAVVGGNVETSQRLVDVLLGALQLAAASQGTMNNVLFGDDTFGYYETICGGAGATSRGPGCDAVHTHMTNTRLTDPELLEQRYPVQLLEFSIREHSGGLGRHRGGHGAVRKLRFTRRLQLSLLTQRRGPYAPYGLAGGAGGACGQNLLHRADGTRQELPGQTQLCVHPGDVLIIKTPGGGGWGIT